MVVEQLIQQFEPQITNIISYHLEHYQWDKSKLYRWAKKLVPLLQKRVPAAKVAGIEPKAPFVPNIVRDHLPYDDREDGQRYSRWDREIVSDRRAGYVIGEKQLPPRYPIGRSDVRAHRLPIDIGHA